MKPQTIGMLAAAEEDLGVAARERGPAPRPAAYHLQQAAEKALKAILIEESLSFEARSHDLTYLAGILPLNHMFKDRAVEFANLTRFGTSYRYPTPSGRLPNPPDDGLISASLDDIRDIITDIRKYYRAKG